VKEEEGRGGGSDRESDRQNERTKTVRRKGRPN